MVLSEKVQNVQLSQILIVFAALSLIRAILHSFSRFKMRPRHMILVNSRLPYLNPFSHIQFLLNANKSIMSTYAKNNRLTFAIPSLVGYQVLVSSLSGIQELARAPKHIISFHEAMNDRLNHKLIMFGFEHNAVDPHDTIPIHVLKVQLRGNLDELKTGIQRRIAEGIENHLGRSQQSSSAGTWTVSIFALAKDVTNLVNNQVLFGGDLASNDKFQSATLRYGWDGAIAMEVCRLMPGFIAPLAAKCIMGWSGAMNRVGEHVTQLVTDRLNARDTKSNTTHLDCTEFVINASRTPSQKAPARIVQQLVALLFASAHQLPMAITWAVTMLAVHNNYVELLRKEIDSFEKEDSVELPIQKLHLLDCFLRESSRLNPLDGLSVQRKATKDFTFSDGSQVPAGNLIAVPQQAVMMDESNFKNSNVFNPFRFMSPDSRVDPVVKYTDINWTYPFWGSPAQSCPGRWYASDLLKYVMVYILMYYDIEPLDPSEVGILNWTTAIVPSFSTRITLRARSGRSLAK